MPMTEGPGLTLTRSRVAGGVWEGILSGAKGEAPVVEAMVDGQSIAGLELARLPGKPARFAVRLPIPASVITEGVRTIHLQSGGVVLAEITLILGERADDDTRAELALLRAELDLLRRAFQRHVRES
jgi:hypothetical protein